MWVCVCLSSVFFVLFLFAVCVLMLYAQFCVCLFLFTQLFVHLMSKHVFVCVVFVCVWVYAYVYVMSFSPDLQLTVCLLSQSVWLMAGPGVPLSSGGPLRGRWLPLWQRGQEVPASLCLRGRSPGPSSLLRTPALTPHSQLHSPLIA